VSGIRVAAWTVVAVAIVLVTRTVVYALAPGPLAVSFEHRAGGPGVGVVSAVVLGGAFALASATLLLAALAVRVRAELEARPPVAVPRLRLAAASVRACALFATTSIAFALLESYVHWRAGLGWHGLACLTGPVHRNAIPILAALSVLAAAAACALEHVREWLRREVAALAASLPPATGALVAAAASAPRGRDRFRVLRSRGPPLPIRP
jgi:hypothetical protein